jgi:hypothetical protein
MFLACIEPAIEVDHERRTFECSTCAYGETITVNFRIDRGEPRSVERGGEFREEQPDTGRPSHRPARRMSVHKRRGGHSVKGAGLL